MRFFISNLDDLKKIHSSYKEGNLIKTCFDHFEIYDKDNLKEEFLFLEKKLYEALNSNKYLLTNTKREIREDYQIKIDKAKFISKIKKDYKSNIYILLKACLLWFLYSLSYEYANKNKNLPFRSYYLLKILIIDILDNSNNFSKEQFQDLSLILHEAYYKIYDYRNHKNLFQDRLEEILRGNEDNDDIIKALNNFFYGYFYIKDLKKIISWYDKNYKMILRAKDLYPIFENDPHKEIQLLISDKIKNIEIIYEENIYKETKFVIAKTIDDKDLLLNLLKNDKTNEYFKSFIRRYIFILEYFYFYFSIAYNNKYREIISNYEIKIISKKDFLDVFKLLKKIIRYDNTKLIGNITKSIANLKNQNMFDKDILKEIKEVILKSDNESFKNSFYKVVGIILYQDELGKSIEVFLEKHKQYNSEFHDIFLDIYNLGKDSNINTNKINKLKAKLDKIPKDIIENLFKISLSSALEQDNIGDETNELFFRGILFLIPLSENTLLLKELYKIATKFFKKVNGLTVNEKLANACVTSLKNNKNNLSLALLSKLKYATDNSKAKKFITKALEEEAKKRNISVDDIEDISVQDFSLKDGKITFEIEENKIILEVKSFNNIELTYLDENNKILKNPPNKIKNEAKDKLKEIKNLIKEIEKTFTTQKDRIETFYLKDRVFSFDKWRELFLENETLKPIINNLIWEFKISDKEIKNIFIKDNIFVDNNNNKIDFNPIEVRLWHPLNSEINEILLWRNFISNNEIKQPFKQAFREVYLITDAELKTKDYSNRFSAHILKQHQFSALAKLKDWNYSLLGAYDDGRSNEVAYKKLVKWNINAEFWINEVYAEDSMSDSGIWNYISTDQVRFTKNNLKLDLENIPKIVFSEIMREVDLFVGVTSIGNDPNWSNEGRYNNYWQGYSFGELSETANTRKSLLLNLIPKLKIANKASIEGRFLKIIGNIRSYKIHLGSSNILMEPNDQYLCIVPDIKGKKEDIYLPFDDDKVLSLILSKAFMLAEDNKIKDTSILNQIKK
ncbi:MAG: DUF4132 domain-containing protein [Candidatus Sericytochromatia bacterium]